MIPSARRRPAPECPSQVVRGRMSAVLHARRTGIPRFIVVPARRRRRQMRSLAPCWRRFDLVGPIRAMVAASAAILSISPGLSSRRPAPRSNNAEDGRRHHRLSDRRFARDTLSARVQPTAARRRARYGDPARPAHKHAGRRQHEASAAGAARSGQPLCAFFVLNLETTNHTIWRGR